MQIRRMLARPPRILGSNVTSHSVCWRKFLVTVTVQLGILRGRCADLPSEGFRIEYGPRGGPHKIQAKTAFTTLPSTSVSRKSLPA